MHFFLNYFSLYENVLLAMDVFDVDLWNSCDVAMMRLILYSQLKMMWVTFPRMFPMVFPWTFPMAFPWMFL
jgi:hypothetical protein